MDTLKEVNEKISSCVLTDSENILSLYQSARDLQTQKGMVVWPIYEKDFIEKEIKEQRQWKLVIDDTIACNWGVTFSDKEIWGEKDKNDAIYIHRIVTNPNFRGNRYVDRIVNWAKGYATQRGKQFIRLDTLGNNTKLIEHYTSAGFQFLGIFELTDTSNLPGHYQVEPNCCLFEIDLTKGNRTI
ncbi:MAG TPA: GNAT family N-acetyltransferase [Chitinophagaceae bacterium]|nr:GNAT family N-acetyltransferase [Chitinophagaceae bacterium]